MLGFLPGVKTALLTNGREKERSWLARAFSRFLTRSRQGDFMTATNKAPAPAKAVRIVVENRQARHQFFIEDTFEAGLILEGWEVKSILAGQATFNGGGAYVKMTNGEAFIESLTVTPLAQNRKGLLLDCQPGRARKLLLRKTELVKLCKKVTEKGYTVVPLSISYNGKLKMQIGLAKGKNGADKRATIKERDLTRELSRQV